MFYKIEQPVASYSFTWNRDVVLLSGKLQRIVNVGRIYDDETSAVLVVLRHPGDVRDGQAQLERRAPVANGAVTTFRPGRKKGLGSNFDWTNYR